MGAAYGKQLRWATLLLTRLYLDRIVCQNDSNLIKARHSRAAAALTNWPSAYSQELNEIATAARLTPGALAYGNQFLDLGNVRAGCRSAVVQSEALLIHGHNLDWDTLGGLGRWTTSVIRRDPSDGRFRTVAIGFPGMVGALDIINEKGLALSFNQLGWGKGNVTEPVWIMMRRIAETCPSLEAARKIITNAPPGMPFVITVSDAVRRSAAIYERTSKGVTERLLHNGWAAAGNAPQGTESGASILDRVMAESSVRTVSDLQKVLSSPEVMMGSNIYSVIFDFNNNTLFLASGQIPAAAGTYRVFQLFDQPSTASAKTSPDALLSSF